jgi:hypothetical protein
VKDATSALYEQIILRIGKENLKIEGDIVKTIERLKYVPKDLEELNDLR